MLSFSTKNHRIVCFNFIRLFFRHVMIFLRAIKWHNQLWIGISTVNIIFCLEVFRVKKIFDALALDCSWLNWSRVTPFKVYLMDFFQLSRNLFTFSIRQFRKRFGEFDIILESFIFKYLVSDLSQTRFIMPVHFIYTLFVKLTAIILLNLVWNDCFLNFTPTDLL